MTSPADKSLPQNDVHSMETLESRLLLSATIGSVAVSPNPVHLGGTIQVSALQVTATGSTIKEVDFYRDLNADGQPQANELLGADTASDGGWTWSGSTAGWTYANSYKIMAVAKDVAGNSSAAASVVMNMLPALDSYGSIGTFSTAYDLGVLGQFSATDLSIDTPNTTDCFQFKAHQTGAFTATITFTNSLGDLSLAMYDGNQAVVATSTTTNDTETLTYQVQAGQTYYIRIAGASATAVNYYDMTLTSLGQNQPPAIGSLTIDNATANFGDRITLTANNVTDDGSVSAVLFWATGRDGQSDFSYTADLIGSDTDGSDGWSVAVPANWLGPVTYYAQAIDNGSPVQTSAMASVTGTTTLAADRFEGNNGNNTPATATQLGLLGNRVENGLTIKGGDWDYYSFQAAADGVFTFTTNFNSTAGNLEMSLYDGTTRLQYALGQNGSATFSPTLVKGHTYLLRVNGTDTTQANRYDLIVNGPGTNTAPTIGSLTIASGGASASTLNIGSAVTLTAVNVQDANNNLQTVNFYADTNGDGLPQPSELLGSGTKGAGSDWTWTGPVNWAPGAHAFFAVAIDSGYPVLSSAPATASATVQYAPVAGEPAETNVDAAHATNLGTLGDLQLSGLALNTTGDVDWYSFKAASAGTMNINLLFNSAQGNLTISVYNNGKSVTSASSTSGNPPDNQKVSFAVTANATYYVVVGGATASTASPQYALLFSGPHGANTGPTISALTASSAAVAPPGGAVTLTATGVAAGNGPVTGVAFYRDDNRDGIGEASELLGTDTTSADGWSWSGSASATAGDYIYLARATDSHGLQSAYVSLSGDVINPDDNYEANNSRQSAFDLHSLGHITLQGSIGSSTDQDWYKFKTDTGGSVTVQLTADQTQGGVDVELYDSTGVLIGQAFASGAEKITHSVTAGNTYYVRVVRNGERFQPNYTLDIAGPDLLAGNAAPTIGSLTPSSTWINRNDSLTLTAGAVADDHGVASVSFYLDRNHDSLATADELLGTDTDGSDGWSWTGNADWPAGTYTVLAQATDSGNPALSSVVLAAATATVHVGPSSDAYDPNQTSGTARDLGTLGYAALNNLVLETSGGSDWFSFTAAATGDAVINLAALDVNGTLDVHVFDSTSTEVRASSGISDSKSVVVSVTAGASYQIQVTGEASPVYSLTITSPPSPANVAPTIGGVTATAGDVHVGDSLTLTATNVADSDGTISQVQFYIDFNGDGQADPSEMLGSATKGAGNDWTWTGPANFQPGTYTFLAKAIDSGHPASAGIAGVSKEILPGNAAPVIGSLAIDEDTVIQGDSVTLYAIGVSAGSGIGKVDFYRDLDGDGVLNTSKDAFLGSSYSGSDGIYSLTASAYWPVGYVRYFAVAHDKSAPARDSAVAVAEQTVLANQPPTIGSLTASSAGFVIGSSITLTANNATDPDGSVKSVSFYRDINGDGIGQPGELIGTGTKGTSGSNWTWTGTVGWAAGTYRFLAQATDDSTPAALSPFVALDATVAKNQAPTVGSVTVSPSPIQQSQTLTLTAVNAADVDGSVNAVTFYRDINNDGIGTSDEKLGTGTKGATGYVWTGVVTWAPGDWVYLAQATDNGSPAMTSTFVSATGTVSPNHAPVVGSVKLSTDPTATLVTGRTLGITANDVSDPDNNLKAVNFYIDLNHDGIGQSGELLGTDASAQDGWSWSGAVSKPVGSYNILVQATDNSNPSLVSNVASSPLTITANAAPTIGALTSDLPAVYQGASLTLTANTVTDSDGTVTKVSFYRDLNGDGLAQPGELLGTGAKLSTANNDGSYNWTWTGYADWSTGPAKFLAIATDDGPIAADSAPKSGTVNISPILHPPTVGSLTVSPSPVNQQATLTLTANNVLGGDSVVRSVRFYRDINGDGIGQGNELLGVATDGTNGWTWSGAVTWGAGTWTYLAQASDGVPLATAGFVSAAGAVNPAPDAFESNNTAQTATNLGTLGYRNETGLSSLGDDDWYKFTAGNAGSATVSIGFTDAQGHLTLELYDSTQTLITSSDQLGADGQSVTTNVTAGATYYVRVYSSTGATNANYSLTVAAPNLSVDAEVTAVTMGPTYLYAGEHPTAASVTIKNDGSTAITQGQYTLEMFLSADGTITAADTSLGTATLNFSLAAGASTTISLTGDQLSQLVVPQGLAKVRYTLGAHLTPQVGLGEYPDPNDANNWKAGGTNTVVSQLVIEQTFTSARPATFQDIDGDTVTIKLTSAGSGIVRLTSPNAGSIDWLGLSGTSATSALSITVKKGSGGDGIVNINDLDITSALKSVTAAQSDLYGDAQIKDAATVSFRDVIGGTVDLQTAGASGDKLTFRRLSNATVDSLRPITSLTAENWAGGLLSAPAVSTLTIKGNKAAGYAGDFTADMTLSGQSGLPTLGSATLAGASDGHWSLTGNAGAIKMASSSATWNCNISGQVTSVTTSGKMQGTWQSQSLATLKVGTEMENVTMTLTQLPSAVTPALGTATVANWVKNSKILSAGNIGSFKASSFEKTDLFAGVLVTHDTNSDGVYDLPTTPTDFADPVNQPDLLASIGALTITGYRLNNGPNNNTDFLNSNVAAWSLGSMNILNPATSSTATMGLASHTIQSVSYRNGMTQSYTWNNTQAGLPQQFGGLQYVSVLSAVGGQAATGKVSFATIPAQVAIPPTMGTANIVLGANPVAGDTFTVNDGVNAPVTFTFSTTKVAATDVLIGADSTATASNIVTTVVAAHLGLTAAATTATVTLTASTAGARSNWGVTSAGAHITTTVIPGTNPNAADGYTLTVNDGVDPAVTFTFRATPVNPTDVQIGATAADSMSNLAGVINGAGLALTAAAGGTGVTLTPDAEGLRFTWALTVVGNGLILQNVFQGTDIITNVFDGYTVTVNDGTHAAKTFTFRTTPLAATDVPIGGIVADSMRNLAGVINAAGLALTATADGAGVTLTANTRALLANWTMTVVGNGLSITNLSQGVAPLSA